jgi:hypothetical protein
VVHDGSLPFGASQYSPGGARSYKDVSTRNGPVTRLLRTKWLLDTPKSADRGLALILGAQDCEQLVSAPAPAEFAGS